MNEKQETAGADQADLERRRLQETLDREFPAGAMCAVVVTEHGRIEPGPTCATGRLVCEDAERKNDGKWWFSIAIDPRLSAEEDSDVLRLWTERPHPHEGTHLWEAAVLTGGNTKSVLRLNGDPPAQWRPTEEMRLAITAVYADLLKAPVGA